MDIARPDIALRKRHKLIIVAVLGVIVVALITMGRSRLKPAAPTVEGSTVWVESYEVTRRTREIGIRMATGAQQMDVITTVLRQAAILVLAGAFIGTVTSLGVTRFLASFLYSVSSSHLARSSQ